MLHLLRQYTPMLIGSGAVLLSLDGLILFYRGLGLDKGTAIYAALVTLLVVGYVLIRCYFKQDRVSPTSEPAERQGIE
jgi:hypothetical protein